MLPGNHDITLDTDFYAQYGLHFHNQEPQDAAACQELLDESPSVLWLKHEAATIDLQDPNGPRTTFKIFGSPFSPKKGMWAFGYGLDEASLLWDRIPLDTDIVVTHTPPKFHCDEARERIAAGCESLRSALWRIRPRLAICGHVHEGRGADRVHWDLEASNIKYKELGVSRWDDPGRGNKKISLVDLTARGGNPIDNDGATGNIVTTIGASTPSIVQSSIVKLSLEGENVTEPQTNAPNPKKSGNSKKNFTAKLGLSRITANLLAIPPACRLPPATRGQGGVPPSQRCDLEALSGRLGRKETCVVNAAIMATSWPRGSAGKTFNKPIVVDIDLPVWG